MSNDISLDRRVTDLETVVEAAGLNEPFTLLGISQGASVCLSYAVRHPKRVARIVLCGGYARGALKRGDADARADVRGDHRPCQSVGK